MKKKKSTYQITVKGNLDQTMRSFLQGMKLCSHQTPDNSFSTITGEVTDQSALSGILNALVDFRYEVLSVNKL